MPDWVTPKIREGYARVSDGPYGAPPSDPPRSRVQRLLRALTRFFWRDFGKGF